MNSIITSSIVLYKNDILILKRAIDSILSIDTIKKIFLVDNSPTDVLKDLAVDVRVDYIHNPSNPGFGASHNVAIQKAIELGSKYHFIVNPDIYFEGDVITPMVAYMTKDTTIGMMMPQILNIDGSIQNLPKLLPSPFSIFWRKFKKPTKAYQRFINQYELREVSPNVVYNTPILSGCFTLLNLDAVKKVGMYDDAYFMYFEDWDLSRRMHEKYKTIYFPNVSVYHGYDSGANKSSKLFKIFLNSAFTYFNKWGWFFDTQRDIINKKALAQFK